MENIIIHTEFIKLQDEYKLESLKEKFNGRQ